MTSIIDICNNLFIPIIKGGYPYQITCVQTKVSAYNAFVETYDGINFSIIINEGIYEDAKAVVGAFNKTDIDDELASIADQLFGDIDFKEDLYRCIIYGSVVFVIFHELSHILRHHLAYVLPAKTDIHKSLYIEVGEVEISPTTRAWEIFMKENFIKMAEFDADAHSIILLTTLSVELLAMLSENYDQCFPNWRLELEQPIHRRCANQLMLYAASLALTLIESKPERSKDYPSPFSRIINLYDAFTQEIYKSIGILDPDDPNKGFTYLKNDDQIKKVMGDFVYPTFLTSVDIILEISRIVRYDVDERYGYQDDNYVMNLLRDFMLLQTSLSPVGLSTPDAQEFNKLRSYRPQFNKQFDQFVNLPS